MKTIVLIDRWNGEIISEHETVASALRAQRRHGKTNDSSRFIIRFSDGSSIPSEIVWDSQ